MTFIYVIVGVPLQLIVALAIAMLLNEGMQGLPVLPVRLLPAVDAGRLGCHRTCSGGRCSKSTAW